jgi:hypothetical protein
MSTMMSTMMSSTMPSKAITPAKPEVGEPGLWGNRFWSCPADGRVYPWAYTPLGATSVSALYLRNSNDDVWEMNSDGTCGDWVGVYIMPWGIDITAKEPQV